jgi:hypothetical protein
MRTVLLKILPGLLIFLNPQETIPDIKTNSSEIKGKMSNSIFQQDRSQLEYLVSILNSDVLEYYHLKNQYNTDSKREAYLESEDYKTKYSELKELKSKIISTSYYLDFEPDYQAERSIQIKYDPGTKNLSVSNDLSYSLFYNEPGFIQLDQFIIKCPAGMTISKKNINYACFDVIEETISFKINDKVLASKIEENKYNLRLLFVFNIMGTTPVQGKTSDLTSADYHLMTNLRKVIAYNSKTNEIYSTYDL